MEPSNPANSEIHSLGHFCPRWLVSLHRPCAENADAHLRFHSVVAISITRLIYLVGLDIASPDVNWNFASAQIWTCVEMNIAIVSGENRQMSSRKLRLWGSGYRGNEGILFVRDG